MEEYKRANITKYHASEERKKFFTHPSKILGVESFRRRVRTHRLIQVGDRVLDIGGGSGIWTDTLRAMSNDIRVYGIDISLTVLKERNPADLCVGSDMEFLPFFDESFDRAFFFASLHHVRNTVRAVREASRVVKTGGYVGFCEPVSARLRMLRRDIEPVDEAEFCFSLGHLLHAVNKAGLVVEYRYHRGFSRRFLGSRSTLALHRMAEKVDEWMNHMPLLRPVVSFGSQVILLARKS